MAANVFVTLPVAPGNGVGASASIVGLGDNKTLIVAGSFTGSVSLQFSADNTAWVDVVSGCSAACIRELAGRAAFARIVSRNLVGTPIVAIGSADSAGTVLTLNVPEGDRGAEAGTSEDISGIERPISMIVAGSDFLGSLVLQGSSDDANWEDVVVFDNPGFKVLDIAAQYARVRILNLQRQTGDVSAALIGFDGGGGGGGGAPVLTSIVPGNQQNTVNWTVVPGALSYNLYYATTPGVVPGGPGVTQIPSVFAPYVVFPLLNGTTYYYVVTANTGAGESAPSNELSGTPRLPAPVASPVVSTGGQNTISWSPVLFATSYNLYRSTSPGVVPGGGGVTEIAGVTSPYVDAGLANNTTYYYVVTALDATDVSDPSNEVSGTPQVNATALFIGGYGDSAGIGESNYNIGVPWVWKYETAIDAWTQLADMPEVIPSPTTQWRPYGCAIFRPENNAPFYISGFWSGIGLGGAPAQPIAKGWYYDAIGDAWIPLPEELPLSLAYAGACHVPSAFHPTGKDRCYVLMGDTSPGPYSLRSFEIDPNNNYSIRELGLFPQPAGLTGTLTGLWQGWMGWTTRTFTGKLALLFVAPDTLFTNNVFPTCSNDGSDRIFLYDVESDTWSEGAIVSGLSVGCEFVGTGGDGGQSRQCCMLNDGRLLAINANKSDGSCIIYDAAQNGWTATGSLITPRQQASICKLLDGRVMIIGGATATDTNTDLCEIYNPATGVWSAAASFPKVTVPVYSPTIPQGRRQTPAITLPDGNVLIAGGNYERSFNTRVHSTAFVYNPDLDSWGAIASIPAPPGINDYEVAAGNPAPYRAGGTMGGGGQNHLVIISDAYNNPGQTDTDIPPIPPAPPVLSCSSPIEDNTLITVDWAINPIVDTYNLYWATTPGVTSGTGTLIAGVTPPFNHTGRTPGQPYYYVATATNINGTSIDSNEVTCTPGLEPAPPSDHPDTNRTQCTASPNVYVTAGGVTGFNTVVATPLTGAFTDGDATPTWQLKSAFIEPTVGASFVRVNPQQIPLGLLCGGCASTDALDASQYRNHVYTFNYALDQWQIRGTLPKQLTGHGAMVIPRGIFAAGQVVILWGGYTTPTTTPPIRTVENVDFIIVKPEAGYTSSILTSIPWTVASGVRGVAGMWADYVAIGPGAEPGILVFNPLGDGADLIDVETYWFSFVSKTWSQLANFTTGAFAIDGTPLVSASPITATVLGDNRVLFGGTTYPPPSPPAVQLPLFTGVNVPTMLFTPSTNTWASGINPVPPNVQGNPGEASTTPSRGRSFLTCNGDVMCRTYEVGGGSTLASRFTPGPDSWQVEQLWPGVLFAQTGQNSASTHFPDNSVVTIGGMNGIVSVSEAWISVPGTPNPVSSQFFLLDSALVDDAYARARGIFEPPSNGWRWNGYAPVLNR
jgi:hypothetical protein